MSDDHPIKSEPGPLEPFGWVFWLVIFFIIFGILYLFFGSSEEMEPIGLEPLLASAAVPIFGEAIPTPPSPVGNEGNVGERSPSNDHSLEGCRSPSDQSVNPNPEGCPMRKPRKFRSIGEELACTALEEILDREVQTGLRPSFLRNPETNRCLEYDCYDPQMRIAVEYNGRQHYEYTPRFHKSKEAFYDQVFRDKVKLELSEKNNIVLISIPYTIDVCDPDDSKPCGYKYNSRIKRDERYRRIREYLSPIVRNIGIP